MVAEIAEAANVTNAVPNCNILFSPDPSTQVLREPTKRVKQPRKKSDSVRKRIKIRTRKKVKRIT